MFSSFPGSCLKNTAEGRRTSISDRSAHFCFKLSTGKSYLHTIRKKSCETQMAKPSRTERPTLEKAFLGSSDSVSCRGIPSVTTTTKKPLTIEPSYFCRYSCTHVTLLVVLFAKCSADLMNTSISGKQGNMKGRAQSTLHCLKF